MRSCHYYGCFPQGIHRAITKQVYFCQTAPAVSRGSLVCLAVWCECGNVTAMVAIRLGVLVSGWLTCDSRKQGTVIPDYDRWSADKTISHMSPPAITLLNIIWKAGSNLKALWVANNNFIKMDYVVKQTSYHVKVSKPYVFCSCYPICIVQILFKLMHFWHLVMADTPAVLVL